MNGYCAGLAEPLLEVRGDVVGVVELLDLDPGVGEAPLVVGPDDRGDVAVRSSGRRSSWAGGACGVGCRSGPVTVQAGAKDARAGGLRAPLLGPMAPRVRRRCAARRGDRGARESPPARISWATRRCRRKRRRGASQPRDRTTRAATRRVRRWCRVDRHRDSQQGRRSWRTPTSATSADPPRRGSRWSRRQPASSPGDQLPELRRRGGRQPASGRGAGLRPVSAPAAHDRAAALIERIHASGRVAMVAALPSRPSTVGENAVVASTASRLHVSLAQAARVLRPRRERAGTATTPIGTAEVIVRPGRW